MTSRIILLFLTFPFLNFGQHAEEILAIDLDEEWIKQNKIKEIEITTRWGDRKGRPRKKKRKINFYYDSDGHFYLEETVKIIKTDSTITRCEKWQHDTICYVSKFDSNGRKIRLEASTLMITYDYDSIGRLTEVYLENQDIGNGGIKVTNYDYNRSGNVERLITKTLNNNWKDYQESYKEDEVNSWLIGELEYNENVNLKKVNWFKGKDRDNLNLYRTIEYSYDKITGFPASARFYNINKGAKLLERIDEFSYKR